MFAYITIIKLNNDNKLYPDNDLNAHLILINKSINCNILFHRIYAQVYHAKGNYHLRPDAGFLCNRESEDIEKFYNEFYSEIDIEPNNIEYIEANAVGKIKQVPNIYVCKARCNIF